MIWNRSVQGIVQIVHCVIGIGTNGGKVAGQEEQTGD